MKKTLLTLLLGLVSLTAFGVTRRITVTDSAFTPPSIIVSDLLMPQPDGSEVLRQALDHDDSWGRRFVIVTAQPLQDAKKQLDARFRGQVLRKPVETEALASAIQWSLSGGATAAVAAGNPR